MPNIDEMGRGTAVLAALALILGLAAVGNFSGVVALFLGIALGVANAEYIREFFR